MSQQEYVVTSPLDIERDRPNACCNALANLITERVAEDRYIETCATCGRRHHVMFVDPLRMGYFGTAV